MGINKSLHGNHVVGVSLSQQQSIEYETDTAFFLDNPQAGTTDEGLSNGKGPSFTQESILEGAAQKRKGLCIPIQHIFMESKKS